MGPGLSSSFVEPAEEELELCGQRQDATSVLQVFCKCNKRSARNDKTKRTEVKKYRDGAFRGLLQQVGWSGRVCDNVPVMNTHSGYGVGWGWMGLDGWGVILFLSACTHSGCYVIGSFLALAETVDATLKILLLDATLYDLLLYL